ncbi:uncharacterized protein LTR77_007672 [Saxophila tyrrhenica]|uniref:GED domain-containing protein n=1 Tax=Saxophila tyrrhenica TaxID=1690608 RepID=A0AAV9P6Q5_9PEZI|nr:hypothetical protein LTR77_007672 [Saxophila tyrrhenica]
MSPSGHRENQPISGSTVRNDEDVDMLNNRVEDAAAHQDDSSTGGEHCRDSSSDALTDVPKATTSETISTSFVQPRTLIRTIGKLESLGIDKTLPSLPKVVVVGDQSHGKSSVIEAICDISLPRNSGTCTRVPFELRTSTSNTEWSCKVSLVYKYTHSRSTNDVSWKKLDTPNIVPFTSVQSKVSLEQVLRLAQVAILSPDRDAAAILQANNPAQATTLKFSCNVVRLEIASSKLPELALYDLPGAISVTEKPEDQYLVRFVDRLLSIYVSASKSIVLLAAAANVDVNTSKTFGIIRDQEAVNRCMGVITKPDLIDRGKDTMTRVRNMLEGKTDWTLEHGWYITKQPTQEELDDGDVTREKTKESEEALFHLPMWSDIVNACPSRLGIQNLQNALSQKLTAHILADLPEINARVQGKLNEVEAELAGFPEQAVAPSMEVHHEADKVAKCIETNLKGSAMCNDFRDEYKSIIEELEKKFNEARPQLTMATPGFKAPPICIGSDDSDEEMSGTPTPRHAKSRKRNDGRGTPMPMRPSQTPSARKAARPETNGIASRTANTAANAAANADTNAPAVFDLAQVRQAYASGNNAGIPGGISTEVTEVLCLKCLEGTASIVDGSLRRIQKHMVDSLASFVHTTLSSHEGTKLFGEAEGIVEELLVEVFEAETASIHNDVARELYAPTVTDKEGFEVKKEAKLAELQQARTLRRVREFFDVEDSKRVKQTSPEERERKAEDKKWVEANLPKDPHHEMIKAMVTPMAYYDIACARITDNLRMKLEYGLMRPLQQDLRAKLLEGLRVTDAAYCADLLAEDPRREQRRRDLLVEKGKLVQALEELDNCRTTAEV